MATHAAPTRQPRSMLLTIVVTVATLYFAQEILIPLALAVLLAFLLDPPTRRLEKGGLKRLPAVLLVVAMAFAVIGSLAWVVGSQALKLAEDLPAYQTEILSKARSLRGAGAGIGQNFEKLSRELQRAESEPTSQPAGHAAVLRPLPMVSDGGVSPAAQPWMQPINGLSHDSGITVPSASPTPSLGTSLNPLYAVALPAPVSPIRSLGQYLGVVLGPLGTAGLVVVFVVFMLLEREGLRDRIIRLVSRGRYTVTTKAVNEAATRISRFVLAQSMVNGSYGLVVGITLWIIGLTMGHGMGFPSFVLWGFLCGVLRFIPYIGAVVAGAFPVAISLAVYPGFGVFFATTGSLVGIELIVNNVVEPWLYGSRTGISTVALLVSAVFWTWLWGLVGLLMSTPLTVCLAVVGKYVPQLKFLNVLLGDQPALPPPVIYYQRLLAGDRREASALVREIAAERGREHVPDEVLMPALLRMRHDRKDGDLSAAEEDAILTAAEDDVKALAADNAADASAPSIRILGCPAHHPAEELSLHMLAALLDNRNAALEVVSTRMLPAEIESSISLQEPALVVVSIVAPGGLVQARYLCRRLRRRFPQLRIVVAYFGKVRSFDKLLVRLRSAGASYVTTSLQQAITQLHALLTTMTPPPTAMQQAVATADNDLTPPWAVLD